MKNYKKAVLTLAVLSTMSLMAADDKIIQVTTFDDEDGENSSQCSLREAVTAASKHQAYGGCPKGQAHESLTNIIQLQAGVYTLKKELQPNSSLLIQGKEPSDYSLPNVITNIYPAATPIKTTISGGGVSRIFNTTNANKPSLSLKNLILTDAKSTTVGGALLVGGTTDLDHVSIYNSQAESGGAFYLNDQNSTLTVNSGEFKGNQASNGSVLAMTCIDNLVDTSRNISLNYSTFIQNGSSSSQSTFAFCGQPTASISSSTITANQASPTTGHIVQFSSKNGAANVNLNALASLRMVSNTIVKNTAQSVLLYNKIGSKTINYNVLGFNNGLSCKYNDGDVTQIDYADIGLEHNAIFFTKNTDGDLCELPKLVVDSAKKVNLDLSGRAFTDLFSTLQPAADFTAYMPMYFPLSKSNDTDLVDVGDFGCANLDQRGIARIKEIKVDSQGMISNTCDIGATEVLRLTVSNIVKANESVLNLIASYQEESDLFKDLLADSTTKPEYLPFYKIRYDYFQNLIKFTQSDQKYRTIFADPFENNLPDEVVNANGGRQIRHLTTDNYTVKVEPVGVGRFNADNVYEGTPDPNLHCEWNANLKRILLYRTDDRITPFGDGEFCKYTLELKNSSSLATSSAYVVGNFINIAPNAPETTRYTIQHGTTQKITVDLLKGANDNGDGLTSILKTNPNKSPFYLNDLGQTQAVRLVKVPDAVTVTADRSGPCPGKASKETCYGGNINMQLNNTLDVFSYKVTYSVYDADGAESNAGVVELNNTATAPDSVRQSGGGSMGVLSVLTLMGLGLLRYRSRRK